MVMPFGLTNALTTFQALMNSNFKGLLWRYVLAFFDDILIYSPSLEIHWEHLCVMLTILCEHKLYASIKKCCFCQSNLEYLGHIISGKGVAINPRESQGYGGMASSFEPKRTMRIFQVDWLLSPFCHKLWKNCSTLDKTP